MHTALKTLLAASAALAAFFPVLAQANPITIADPGYATAQGTASVVKVLLEEQLGKQVETVKAGSVPVIWEALNRNGGEIDIWTDVWLPNQQALVDQYAGEGGKHIGPERGASRGARGSFRPLSRQRRKRLL